MGSAEAVTNFHNLLRCMGDKASASNYAGDDNTEPILAAAKNDELRDEVFTQVLKQLSNNPSSKSTTAGYELLQKLIKDVPLPSTELREYLRGFLEKTAHPEEKPEGPAAATDEEEAVGKRM